MAVRSRDERIETYYHESAWDLAERVVDLEDEAATLNAECDRARNAWRSARRRAKHLRGGWNASRHAIAAWRRMCQGQTEAMRELITVLSERTQERDRYRLAWLSARRRAADEANYGLEALELKRQEISRLKAALDEARKTTHGPRLECVGPDGEGGEVWRVVDDSKKP